MRGMAMLLSNGFPYSMRQVQFEAVRLRSVMGPKRVPNGSQEGPDEVPRMSAQGPLGPRRKRNGVGDRFCFSALGAGLTEREINGPRHRSFATPFFAPTPFFARHRPRSRVLLA